MSFKILGIDPGYQGALVVLEGNRMLAKIPAPVIKGKKTTYDVNKIVSFVKEFAPDFVVLEHSQAFPGQGSVSMHSIGVGFGMYWGIITALGISHTIPPPRIWQKEVLGGFNKGDSKQAAMLFAARMWPKERWEATERCTKQHDGMIDAACLAYYGTKVLI